MDEGHAVVESEDFVGEALRLTLGQFAEHRLNQPLVLGGPLGLGLIAHHSRLHRVLHFRRPGRLAYTPRPRPAPGLIGAGEEPPITRPRELANSSPPWSLEVPGDGAGASRREVTLARASGRGRRSVLRARTDAAPALA